MLKNYTIETEKNPFNAPTFYVEYTDSTMNDARIIATQGVQEGTCIRTDAQSLGRGRVQGRVWDSTAGESVLTTTILKRPIIAGFTLRVGLAVARTIESFLPPAVKLQVKWPNDVLFEGKKLSGILCESADGIIYIGVGINWAQQKFLPPLDTKASSIAILCKQFDIAELPPIQEVLQRYLENLKIVLEEKNWHAEVTKRLYLRNERFDFLPGDPTTSTTIHGIIKGIGESGELIFLEDENQEKGSLAKMHRFFSGELC